MIIDSHLHLPYEYTELAAKRAVLLDELKCNGVDKGIVIADSYLESCIGSTKECEELFADSKTVRVIAGVSPLVDFDAQLGYCRELLAENRIAGLKIYTGHEKFFCNDTRLDAVYDLALEYRVPVLFHTGWDDSQYAAPTVMRELAMKRRNNIFVYCHCFYPKLDECFEKLLDCENVYFDTSSIADDAELIPKIKHLLEKGVNAAPERFIFGSDYGSCSQKAHLEFAASLDINDIQRELLMHKNAEKVYNL